MAAGGHHKILIIGGGTAGIAVAAKLRRQGETDIGLIEPSDRHYYQPLWTLVGGGCATVAETERSEASVMPKGVAWVKAAAESIDPDEQTGAAHRSAQILPDPVMPGPLHSPGQARLVRGQHGLHQHPAHAARRARHHDPRQITHRRLLSFGPV